MTTDTPKPKPPPKPTPNTAFITWPYVYVAFEPHNPHNRAPAHPKGNNQ